MPTNHWLDLVAVFDEIPILNPMRSGDDFANPIWYNSEYRKVEVEQSEAAGEDSDYEMDQDDNNKDEGFDDDDRSTSSDEADAFNDKYLIFTTGNKTYTPHQIGKQDDLSHPPSNAYCAI